MFIEINDDEKTVTIRENIGENEDDVVIDIEDREEE